MSSLTISITRYFIFPCPWIYYCALLLLYCLSPIWKKMTSFSFACCHWCCHSAWCYGRIVHSSGLVLIPHFSCLDANLMYSYFLLITLLGPSDKLNATSIFLAFLLVTMVRPSIHLPKGNACSCAQDIIFSPALAIHPSLPLIKSILSFC